MIATFALLLAPWAHAGLLDVMSAEERQVRICQDAATPAERNHEYARAAGIWEACLSEATRLGYEEALPALRDQAALAREMADAASLRTTDPDRWAQRILAVAAMQGSADYPTDVVAEVFRAWMQTEAGKTRAENVRTVSVQFEGAVEPRTAELVRRYVQDLGLRWADPGDPDVDTIVYARLAMTELEPRTSRQGSLARVQTTLMVDSLRYRNLDRTEEGFDAVATSEHAEADKAREEALRGACQRTARRLLKAALRVLFA